MRVLCVAGARPNFMKVKPVMDSLTALGVETTLVHTGQHYDEQMSDVFFEDIGLRSPDFHLRVGSGTQAVQTAKVMVAFEPVLADVQPDIVVVVGDVNSTVGCALVAAKAGSLVAHVEAGLRSRDWAMPEEVNRVVTDRLSDYLFAPSEDAVNNLDAEGYRQDQIVLAGNTMVDTLVSNVDRARRRPTLSDLDLVPGGYGLVTLHRPSNVDSPYQLSSLMSALSILSEELPLVFPAHPRTASKLAGAALGPNVRLIPPQGYLDFLALEAAARVVMTDSGGVQEETTALGVPCMTLRSSTERPVTVAQGTNHIVGTGAADIIRIGAKLIRRGCEARCPALWDGHAGDRIAQALVAGGQSADRPRPTDLVRSES